MCKGLIKFHTNDKITTQLWIITPIQVCLKNERFKNMIVLRSDLYDDL